MFLNKNRVLILKLVEFGYLGKIDEDRNLISSCFRWFVDLLSVTVLTNNIFLTVLVKANIQ